MPCLNACMEIVALRSWLKKPAYSHKLEATAVATAEPVPFSRRGQDQQPAVTERDAQLDVRWWCFNIDLLAVSASSERRWSKW